MGRLVECWTSVAASRQRRGRAGRTRPGVCYRLIPTAMHENGLEAYTTPEIARSALEDLILSLLSLRLDVPIREFASSLITPPSTLALDAALRLLQEIGATQPTPSTLPSQRESPTCDTVELTPLGVHLSRLGVSPHLGKTMIYGAILGCLDDILSVCAALVDRSPFIPRQGGKSVRVCLGARVRGIPSTPPSLSFTHTHTHTHIYIYIYSCMHTHKHAHTRPITFAGPLPKKPAR